MKQIHKEYQRSFLLEPTKLTRLLDRIHERLGEHQHVIIGDHFDVFLSGDRRDEMSSVDDVLAVENSRKHKIQRLLITCSSKTERAAGPENEIVVDFATNKTSGTGTSNTKVIAVSIRSDQSGWASRALSEVEEQVERTFLRYTQHAFALVGLVVCGFILFISQVISVQFVPQTGDVLRAMWLRGPDLDRVEQILSQRRVLSEADLREIATLQLRNVLQEQRPKELPQKGRTRQLITLGIPLLVVIGCVFTLLLTCYPSAVFLWGDEVERYANKVQRRKILWSIIGGVTVIGVLSKLFFEGIISWIPLD